MFEEDEAWEKGFLAGLKFAEETVGPLNAQPQSLREALEANPYKKAEETEPEPLEPPPDPLPNVLIPPWYIASGDGMAAPPAVRYQAILDPQYGVYRWKDGNDSQGCGIDQVDWLIYQRPDDAAWLVATMHELSTAKVWVKPVSDGWHLVEGGKHPTFFIDYRFARARDKDQLHAILAEHKWPLRQETTVTPT